MRPNDPHAEANEAVRTSQTRFGPRPVPTGDRTSGDDPYGTPVSSRIPPSGRVSPDGRHAWPEPSMAAKVIVWGGVALGVAGLTAAATMTARRLAGTDQPHARKQGPIHAPRFAEMDEDERDEVRRRVRIQALEDDREAARLRAEAALKRQRRGNVAQDLTRTATELSASLNGVARSISEAFESFRGVSRQANSILADFVVAADQLKAILNASPGPRPVVPQDRDGAGDMAGPERIHRL